MSNLVFDESRGAGRLTTAWYRGGWPVREEGVFEGAAIERGGGAALSILAYVKVGFQFKSGTSDQEEDNAAGRT